MHTYIFVIVMLTLTDAFLLHDIIDWHAFKHKYEKKYDSYEDDMHHMLIFLDHKHKIEEHNQRFKDGLVSFKMALNEYSDMQHEHFVSKMNGFRYSDENENEVDKGAVDFVGSPHLHLATSVDWRGRGAVTNVKNQGRCGSCYTFAATGALEGQYFLKHGHLISLSEQNLLDCSPSWGNHGCYGGQIYNAFSYIKWNGIKSEKKYPYTGFEDICQDDFNNNNSVSTLRGFVRIPAGDEGKLQEAISTVGPIAVAIDASHPSLHHYSSGIYHEHDCSNYHTNHAVLVVGYGTDEFNQEYYIVKNSWGTSWGEGGYFRLARNHHNHCGIANRAVYPQI